jgi:tetratricopeptide (TPR) repeat protein
VARAFVIRPFGTKKDASGREIDFEAIHRDLIGRALAGAKLGGSTTGEIIDAGNIREDMFSLILEADLVICDVTVHNANVFYELGIRHALRKKRTVLVRGRQSADQIPFDLLTDRYLAYDLDDPAGAEAQLVDMLEATLGSDRDTDSPVFRMLPSLPEADAASVQAIPLDFREEVDRAVATRSTALLRLLAGDLRGRRFQWAGLRLIARAQWRLKDYRGAERSLEAIRDIYPTDVEANLALANVYERLAKAAPPADEARLLAASDHAIERVLGNRAAAAEQRVEALALRGRNHKTEWWRDLRDLPTVAERRAPQSTSASARRTSPTARRSSATSTTSGRGSRPRRWGPSSSTSPTTRTTGRGRTPSRATPRPTRRASASPPTWRRCACSSPRRSTRRSAASTSRTPSASGRR